MTNPTHFSDFLVEIRPTANQNSDLQRGHTILRNRISQDEDLQKILLTTFIQGSYRRKTAIRPNQNDRPDVDVVVVTNLDVNLPENEPNRVYERFKRFVRKHYEGKYKTQSRSINIELSYVNLDLVIAVAPSEMIQKAFQLNESFSDWDIEKSDQLILDNKGLIISSRDYVILQKLASEPRWKQQPLLIPDRDLNKWITTHPIEQIRWTAEKNQSTNGHFINVVKAIKWWKVEMKPIPKYPKSFPLERIIGDCCPDGINYISEGIVSTFENILNKYRAHFLSGLVPRIGDYGIPENNVLQRIKAEDFHGFYNNAKEAAELARKAYDSTDIIESVTLWRELFGNKFPKPPDKSSGFTPPPDVARPNTGRFA